MPLDEVYRRISKLQEKIHDIAVKRHGYRCKIVHRDNRTETNIFGDHTYSTETYKDSFVILDFPLDQLIINNRENRNLYLEDILPITGYFRFVDDVKPGDYIQIDIWMNRSRTNWRVEFEVGEQLTNITNAMLGYAYHLYPRRFDEIT